MLGYCCHVVLVCLTIFERINVVVDDDDNDANDKAAANCSRELSDHPAWNMLSGQNRQIAV